MTDARRGPSEALGNRLPPATVADILRAPDSEVEVLIEGGSMAPTLPRGARARVRSLQLDSLRSGSIVAFLAGGRTLTIHRLVHVDRTHSYAVTRGDANVFCDPPVPLGDIVGSVTAWRVGDGEWAPPPEFARRVGPASMLSNLNATAMSRTLRVHVRLSQGVALLSLGLSLPWALVRYGSRAFRPPALVMFRLRRPIHGD